MENGTQRPVPQFSFYMPVQPVPNVAKNKKSMMFRRIQNEMNPYFVLVLCYLVVFGSNTSGMN